MVRVNSDANSPRSAAHGSPSRASEARPSPRAADAPATKLPADLSKLHLDVCEATRLPTTFGDLYSDVLHKIASRLDVPSVAAAWRTNRALCEVIRSRSDLKGRVAQRAIERCGTPKDLLALVGQVSFRASFPKEDEAPVELSPTELYQHDDSNYFGRGSDYNIAGVMSLEDLERAPRLYRPENLPPGRVEGGGGSLVIRGSNQTTHGGRSATRANNSVWTTYTLHLASMRLDKYIFRNCGSPEFSSLRPAGAQGPEAVAYRTRPGDGTWVMSPPRDGDSYLDGLAELFDILLQVGTATYREQGDSLGTLKMALRPNAIAATLSEASDRVARADPGEPAYSQQPTAPGLEPALCFLRARIRSLLLDVSPPPLEQPAAG